MRGLTDRQSQVLEFIRSFRHAHGYAPTLREIGRHMGIRSTNGVAEHLRALEKKGYISTDAITARGIVILNEGWLPSAAKPEAIERAPDPREEIERLRLLLRRAYLVIERCYSATDELGGLRDELAAEGVAAVPVRRATRIAAGLAQVRAINEGRLAANATGEGSA